MEKIVSKIHPYISSDYAKPVIKKYSDTSRGKKSCNFIIDENFVENHISTFGRDIEDLDNSVLGNRISRTYTNPIFLLNAIKEKGWNKLLDRESVKEILFQKYGRKRVLGDYRLKYFLQEFPINN